MISNLGAKMPGKILRAAVFFLELQQMKILAPFNRGGIDGKTLKKTDRYLWILLDNG